MGEKKSRLSALETRLNGKPSDGPEGAADASGSPAPVPIPISATAPNGSIKTKKKKKVCVQRFFF